MRSQYLGIKRAYSDAVVLFRVGDFLETYYEDAKILAQTCGIRTMRLGKSELAPVLWSHRRVRAYTPRKWKGQEPWPKNSRSHPSIPTNASSRANSRWKRCA